MSSETFREPPHPSEIRELSEEFFGAIEQCAFSPEDAARIERAYHFAMRLHAKQPVRTDGPYTHHILRVALGVLHLSRNPNADAIVVALLHDAAEDHNKELTEILSRGGDSQIFSILHFNKLFGRNAAIAVYWLTKNKNAEGTREEVYRDYVENIVKQNPLALLVKIADFIDNASGIQNKPKRLGERLARKWQFVPTVLVAAIQRIPDDSPLLDASGKEAAITAILQAKRAIAQVLSSNTRSAAPL